MSESVQVVSGEGRKPVSVEVQHQIVELLACTIDVTVEKNFADSQVDAAKEKAAFGLLHSLKPVVKVTQRDAGHFVVLTASLNMPVLQEERIRQLWTLVNSKNVVIANLEASADNWRCLYETVAKERNYLSLRLHSEMRPWWVKLRDWAHGLFKDPARDCQVYKTEGCAHVDGLLCNSSCRDYPE